MAKEQPKAAEPPADAAAPAKPKLPLMIGMVAVGLAVGGGTGAAVLGPMMAKKMAKPAAAASKKHAKTEEAKAEEAPAEDSAADEEGAPPEEEKAKEGGKEGAEAPVHVLDNLVLNPANSGGSRFLLLTVALELKNPSKKDEFKTRDAELRDIILTSLSNKTVEQLTDIAQRDSFKTEIIAAVEKRFGKRSIKRLYFPQFVVQ